MFLTIYQFLFLQTTFLVFILMYVLYLVQKKDLNPSGSIYFHANVG